MDEELPCVGVTFFLHCTLGSKNVELFQRANFSFQGSGRLGY